MLSLRKAGLYCAAGDFYIDPMRPVKHAVITHAHADHARSGSEHYYATEQSAGLLRKRLGADIDLTAVPYQQEFMLGKTALSLHSAGHVLGSAQVRIDDGNAVSVVSGDYKRTADQTCEPFEEVICDTFVTEATFALPIYRWPSTALVVKQIYDWWQFNKSVGKTSVLFCYSLGKAQRVLAELRHLTDQTVLLHGAVVPLVEIYRKAGIEMAATRAVSEDQRKRDAYTDELIMAPPGANGSAWMRRFANTSTGFCSGWMRIRGNRRRQSYDRGFVLSDHADWPGLIQTIQASQAKKIYVTHGKSSVLIRYLLEMGLQAEDLEVTRSE